MVEKFLLDLGGMLDVAGGKSLLLRVAGGKVLTLVRQ